MKSSILVCLLFIGFAVTVLSAPIRSDVIDVSGALIGLAGSALTYALLVWAHCIKGAINARNYHNAIDHYFEKLKKWEVEKMEMVGRNNTPVGF